jgi:hypothetical protein
LAGRYEWGLVDYEYIQELKPDVVLDSSSASRITPLQKI